MKIAIHKAKNTFSEEWIAYCEEKGISYKTVDCYSSTILAEIADCNLLFWHHNHADPRDVLFAKQL
jgi:hypothetical protein